MNYMIMLPSGGMGIVIDSHIYDISDALDKFPDITNDLVASGVFNTDGVIVGDTYRVGLREFKYRIKLYTDYPEQYLVDDVVECAGKFGSLLSTRSFNWCHMVAFAEEDARAFEEWSATNRPGWVFVIESVPVIEEVSGLPTPEEAVLDEKRIADVVITPEDEEAGVITQGAVPPIVEILDADELGVPGRSVEAAVAAIREEDSKLEEYPVSVEETVNPDNIPEECRGETWAQTWKHCRPADVVSDAYCVEHNWEKRNDYYIMDCMMTGNRLIHSDKCGVNFSVPAKSCR